MFDDLLGRARERREGMLLNAKASAAESVMSSPSAGWGFGSPSTGLAKLELAHYRGWVHACVSLIARRIAGQPIMVGRKARGGSLKRSKAVLPAVVKQAAEEIEPVESHWLLDVMRKPNPYTLGYELMYLTVASLELVGEVFWWLLPNPDGLEVWYLPRSWVRPEDDQDALFTRYFIRPQNTGEEVEVPPEQIVRFRLPDPANPLKGVVSPLQAQMRAVAADESLQVAQHKAFENGLHPGVAIVIGRHPDVAGVPGQRPILTKEQRATLTAALKQAYRGVMNAGEPAILDGLVEDIRKITNTPQEMDFLQSGEATKARIFQGFGVNPISAGQVEGANRASATVADEHLVSNTLNPIIEHISGVLTYDLAPRLGEPDLLVWLDPCRPRDPDAERMDRDAKLKSGCYTRNEVRGWYGDPPLEGDEGEELVSPGALAPLGSGIGGEARSGVTFPYQNQNQE